MADGLRTDKFPESKLVIFVHTAPWEIEPYKPISKSVSASQRAEEKQRQQLELSLKSDLVAAVGPRLTRETQMLLVPFSADKKVFEILPGLSKATKKPDHVRPAQEVLLI